jgi:glycogen debranching enzyme
LPDGLTVINGGTFFVSDANGDAGGVDTEGLFDADVRHLSVWRLLVDGAPMHLLSSRNVDHLSARFYGTLAGAHVGHNPPISIARIREVRRTVREDVVIENNSTVPAALTLELRYGSDFLDIFELKRAQPAGEVVAPGTITMQRGEDWLTLRHESDGFSRLTELRFSRPFEAVAERARFDLALAPRARWKLGVEIVCSGEGIDPVDARAAGVSERVRPRGSEGDLHAGAENRYDEARHAPRLETDAEALRLSYRQSLADLDALRFPAPGLSGATVPAAGVPWFMTLFGRDSIITAYQALPFMPGLARATLRSLALLQASERDDYRDAEPGKILHELRRGKLSFLGRTPHTPYYGTHDATPLFLVLLDEYERWTADRTLVEELREPALAALSWIERDGDPDGDGYLEYRTRSDRGLANQCWKDSGAAIAFASGELAAPPIATCEIQGYAYDARVRAARLAREFWGDDALADRLEADAHVLKERFDRDFWCGAGQFALALDARKRQVDSMTSNVGHLLWSGIVDRARAEVVAERLLAQDMFNGWGIRTMSAKNSAYNPIGYHVGTVWPHDSGLVAEGLRRYGFTEEAARLTGALFDASTYFGHRLPEVFAGFDRSETGMPVEYPTASRPQAWSAGAILLGLRTILGLDVDHDLVCAPALPEGVGSVRLTGVPFRGDERDVG